VKYTTVAVDMHDAATVVEGAEQGARALEAGELLVHPTSSLYGVGAAVSPETDRAIARLKGRSPGKPLIRLARQASAVRALSSVVWDARCERLAADFWPGPLTLVLDDGTRDGFAIRVDGHPLVLAILERFGGLMTSTSVNRAGDPPARDPAEVREVLGRAEAADVPLTFLDAGPLPGSKPSTVLGLQGGSVRVLRPGAVPVDSIERSLGEAVTS
jgi:L-threonylcarbamoyladenylate synthase